MSVQSIRIAPLQDAPDALSHCARWLHRQWGQAAGHSLDVTTEWLREVIAPESGEAAFVAFAGSLPVGVCLLVRCDLKTRADLTPWVSSFYVLPDYRRRSIGSALLAAAEEAAAASGWPALYLYTPSAESLCLRRGWRVMERFALDGRDFALMEKALG
jgi:GNAT superfamily N-acetyltransferase